MLEVLKNSAEYKYLDSRVAEYIFYLLYNFSFNFIEILTISNNFFYSAATIPAATTSTSATATNSSRRNVSQHFPTSPTRILRFGR